MSDTVEFDPGIGNLVIDFNDFINNVYSQIMSFKTINQKRIRFKLYSDKIYKYMENNISFYLGCLLWAYHIVKSNENNPKELKGNVFLNLTEEQKKEYDYLIQVSFLDNYFENFERDTLYYTGKKKPIPEIWKKILTTYTEFLDLNKGFVNTKTTNDIVLPENLKNAEIKIDINNLIQQAIEKENLEILLSQTNCFSI